MPQNCKTLNELWDYVFALREKYFPSNALVPIVGNGKTRRPRFMFIFINPTIRNISSNPEWNGPCFPFLGTRQIWAVFLKAGLLDSKLFAEINKNKFWTVKLAKRILRFLQDRGFYFTNLVKLTEYDSRLPDSKKIRLFLPVLKREIELVRPEYVITFGLIPFERLSGEKIKLGEYFSETMKNRKLGFYVIKTDSREIKTIPCYFPVGRGNPKRAVEILKLVAKL
jgi:hypothetical protein